MKQFKIECSPPSTTHALLEPFSDCESVKTIGENSGFLNILGRAGSRALKAQIRNVTGPKIFGRK